MSWSQLLKSLASSYKSEVRLYRCVIHSSFRCYWFFFIFLGMFGWGEGKVLSLLTQDGKHGNENNALKHQRWPGLIATPWSKSLNGLLSMTLGVIQVTPQTRPQRD